MRSVLYMFFSLTLLGISDLWAASKPVSLTLAKAQVVAVENNKMLRAGRAGVQRARAQKLQTWAGHLPSIRLSQGILRSNDAVHAFGFRLKQERFTQADFGLDALNFPGAITNFQTKLELQQPIFNGGQAMARRKQASAVLQAALADQVWSEAEVCFQTAQAYWGVVLARESLEAVRAGLATAQANTADAEVRYREQTVPLSDLLAAQVRVAELRGEEIVAANRVSDATEGLTLVMGMEVDAMVLLEDNLERQTPGADLESLVAGAVQRRPDLISARFRAEAAKSEIRAARSTFLPHVNAFLEVSLDSDEMFKRKGESWMAGAMVTWEFFSGLRTVGQVRAARAAAEGTSFQAEFQRDRVVREVRKTYREVAAAEAQVDLGDEAFKQSEERLRITQLQYREGLATASDLLSAESGLLAAKVRRLQALYTLNVGLARLEMVSRGSKVGAE